MDGHRRNKGCRTTDKSIYPGRTPNREYLPASIPPEDVNDNATSPLVYQVPASVVVTASAFRKFMLENRLDEVAEGLLQGVDVEHIEALQGPAGQIKEIIQQAPMPESVETSIRLACQQLGSGTILVWPVSIPNEVIHFSREYQQSSFLQVTSLEETLGAIRWWWASLFDSTVILYRELHGQRHRDARITLAVQRIPPPASNGSTNS